MVVDRTTASAAPSNGEHGELSVESARSLLNFQAQLCEQACRFEDMVEIVQELCKNYTDLTMNERNLLSCAYKNVIGSRRTSWRILNETLQNAINQQKRTEEEGEGAENIPQQQSLPSTNSNSSKQESAASDDGRKQFNISTIQSILKTIEDELKKHCCNIMDILNNRLIPSASATGESRVFYYKMKGDYIRYLCEISPEQEQKERSNESLLAYKTACDRAMIELPPTHPVRLGLMLNFSVFYYDIMKSPERSCRLAKQAFDDAIAELDTLSEESYRDSTIIMQLLRDNLNLWQSEQKLQLTND